MIFTLIGLLILLYSSFDLKHGFIIYMIYQMVWFPSAKLLIIEGGTTPAIPMYMLMSLGFVIIYFVKGGFRERLVSFPYMLPLILLCIAHFCSCFTAMAGFQDEFSRMLGFALNSFLEVWLMWRIIETKEDFIYLFKNLTIVFFASCIYGFIECIIQDNPLVAYKSTLTPEGLDIYLVDTFRGYRLMSIFEHPIGAGMNFGLFLVIVFISIYIFKDKIKYKKLAILTAVLSGFCVFLTHMRSGILFTIIAAIGFIDIRNKRIMRLLIVALVGIILGFPLYKDHMDVFLSLFSDSARQSVGGSSINMRIQQLSAVTEIMKLSPITGLGNQFANYIDSSFLTYTYGFESIWYESMAKYGLFGVIGNIVLMFYSVVVIPRKFHSKQAFFISLAFWVTYTLTSIPFFRMNLYYIALFYCLKNTNIYKIKFSNANIKVKNLKKIHLKI